LATPRRVSAGPHPDRAAEPRRQVRCPHFPDCVGCPLVGTSYGEQLRRKEADLTAALHAHPALQGLVPEKISGSPLPFGYRNQVKLVFRRRRTPQGGEVLLGVYRPGTHSVRPAHLCAVHDPGLRPLLVTLREEVEALGLPIFDERRRDGALRYALARRSRESGAIHLTIVSATAEVPHFERLLERLRRSERHLESTFLCVNPTPGNTILSSDIRRLSGPGALIERFGRLALESRPDAFVQANVDVATRIYATAEQWLEPSSADVALDVYAGIGGMGLAFGSGVRSVLGIEASPAAVACANGNARRAHLNHVRYVVGDAKDALAISHREGLRAEEGGALLVSVNPPRRGLCEGAREAIVALAPRAVLYLSCDPTTLARDLAQLVGRGFTVRRLRPFDMMPQTPHVEVLALLERDVRTSACT
jgi:23S rRNA (uracil1939-C5)-methyltransferase